MVIAWHVLDFMDLVAMGVAETLSRGKHILYFWPYSVVLH